jgi:hypothetical protein
MRTTASLQKAVHVGVGGHGDTVRPTIEGGGLGGEEAGSGMREGRARQRERDRSDRGSRVEEVTDRPLSPPPRPRAPSDVYDGEQARSRKATEGREEPRRRRSSSSGGEKEAWSATEVHDRSPPRRRESSNSTTRRPARSASPSSYTAEKDRRADKDRRPRSTATPSADPSGRPPPRAEKQDDSFSSAARGGAAYRPWEEKIAERHASSRADDSFDLRASRDSAAEKERFSKEAASSRGSMGESQASPTRQHLSGLLERCQLLKRELQRAVVSHEDEEG